MRWKRIWIVPALAICLLGLHGCAQTAAPISDSGGYSAVVLDSGAVFFGHLSGYGTANPVLREVFYVQSATNPDTKQVSSVLVKRGKEWHAPNRMVLNPQHIVFVEPVTAGSQVASLIAQAK